MRIIVASPPKTGNVWIKSLLAETYGLKVLSDGPTDDARSLQEFVEKGWFEDNAIFHQHYHPTGLLYELADSVSAHIVTTIRNPYDTFVSLFYYVQNFPELFPETHPLYFMLDKPIDTPEVLEFLGRVEGGFGIHIELAKKWVESDRTHVVKYEELKADTYNVMKDLTRQIKPVWGYKIKRAIKKCSADSMRKKSNILQRHIRKASVGDWRNHLTEAHLEIFRNEYGDMIRKIGYEVA